jgi:hypothetical protein
VRVEGHFPPAAPGTQRVQADARERRGQPGPDVAYLPHVAAGHTQPGFLHGVIDVAGRPEHAVGDRTQVRAVHLEPGREFLALVHCDLLSPRSVITVTEQVRPR